MLHTSDILNDRYHLQRKLGYGGFSEVWHAWDNRGKQEVAIKIFLRQDDEGIRLCEREFMRTNRLSHPRVIRFYDFGVFEGAPYLVMPYFHGGTPESQAGELPEETLWRIILDIGMAMHYLHNLRVPVVHNDLKPDNFLIGNDGHYVLADFGISTELADRLIRSLPADMDGETPRAYRPPELFHYRDAQKKHPVKASDIWAFGACLFELATGDTPFGDQGGVFQLMHQMDQPTPVRELVSGPLPEHYSEHLQNLIYQCLEPETWDRPMAHVLVEAAEAYLAGGVPQVIKVPPPKEPAVAAETTQAFWQYGSSEPAPPQPEYQRQSLIAQKKRRLPAWFWAAGGSALTLAGYLFWQKNQVSLGEQEAARLHQIEVYQQDSLRQDSISKPQMPIGNDAGQVSEKQEPELTIAQKAQLQVYNDMLDKAIEASSGNNVVHRSLLAIRKEPENKEKICAVAEGLRKNAVMEVRSFANYTVKEVCKTLENKDNESVEPSKTIGSTGANKSLTPDQRKMGDRLGAKKFGILVGTFLQIANAEKEKDRLLSQFTLTSLIRTIRYDTTGTVKLLDPPSPQEKKKRLNSFTKKKPRNEFSYQVILPYGTKKDAEKVFSDIKTKLVCDCIVYEYSDGDASDPPKLDTPPKLSFRIHHRIREESSNSTINQISFSHAHSWNHP